LRGEPKLSAPGLLDPGDPDTIRVTDDFAETLRDLPSSTRRDDAGLEDAARAALRRTLGRKLGKRPLVDVHLIRV
jgi:ribonuclease J